jgi:hypothetical protein
MRERRDRTLATEENAGISPSRASSVIDAPKAAPIKPAEGIPEDVRRAIDGEATVEDRKRLKRPRVILSTNLTRESSSFRVADEQTRPPS